MVCALGELPYHIQVMVMIAMCLGLRISEIRALQWQDFDLKGRILTLTRSIVGRYVWNGKKTGASEDEVFLDSKLVSVLEDWRKQCVETPEAWLFANADTKHPVHGDEFRRTTCDQRVKRSDCKELAGTAFGKR